MASKPIVARFPDGAEYGFDTPAEARKANADAVVVRYQDGTALDDSDAPASKKSVKADDAKSGRE